MDRWSGHRAGTRAGAGFAACTLTAFLTLTGASGALASAPVWRLQPSPNATLPGGQLESVSCPSATACTAVGSNISTAGIHVTLAERWNGTAWKHQQTPNPAVDVSFDVAPDLTGVSCPAATFCEAVGSYNLGSTDHVSLAEGWNGKRWALQRFPLPAGATSAALSEVSCTSAQFCEAVGSYQTATPNQSLPLAATWTGTSWRLQHAPHPAGDPSVQLNVVSCTSTAFCEAWGGTSPSFGGNHEIAEQWNGSSWHLQPVPSVSDNARSVSCVSSTFCEAVGVGVAQTPSAWVWRGSSWTTQTLPSQLGTNSLEGVSCVSPAFCEAVGLPFTARGGAAAWNGSAWRLQSTPNPAKSASTVLSAVSCAAMHFCESAGDFEVNQGNTPRALTEGWNGSAWGLQRAAAPRGATTNVLSAVSCVSATFCEAVGEHGNHAGTQSNLAEVWNGTSWDIQPAPSPQSPFGFVDNDLEGVSCVSASFCEAVGNGPNGMAALGWNGTSWQLQDRPGAGGIQGQFVSCPSVDFCLSIDAIGRVDTWNGSSWSAGTNLTGFSPVAGVACVSASFCEVVGSGPSGESAANWNGSIWTAQPTPGGAGEDLKAVSCLTATSCESVGELVNQGSPLTLAEVWNGSAWTVQPTPSPSPSTGSVMNGLWCTAASACTAVGQYQTSSSGPLHTLAEVWDGTSWNLRSTPNHVNAGQNILNGVSCGASQVCTAVGQTQNAIGIQATLIESGD